MELVSLPPVQSSSESGSRIPTPRRTSPRGSFGLLSTWLPVWGLLVRRSAWGDSRMAMMCVYSLLLLLLAGLGSRSQDTGMFVVLFSLPLLAALTRAIESATVRPLAFTKLLPMHAGAPKWLVLASLCFLALPLVGVHMAIWSHSLFDGLTLLGLSWGAIAIGHWFAGRGGWLWAVAMIVCCWSLLIAVGMLEDHLSPLAQAISSLAVGGAAVALSPRDRISALMSAGPTRRWWWWRDRAVGPHAGVLALRTLKRPSRPGLVGFGFRLWSLLSPPLGRYSMVGMALCATPLGMLSSPAMPFTWLTCIGCIAAMTANVSAAQFAFLRARPLSRWRLLAGTFAPGTVLVLLLPLSMFLTLAETTFVGPDARAFFPATRGTAKLCVYLHEVVGATFLPSPLPRAGLSLEAWAQLRPLLYEHLLRVGCLGLALFFAVAGVVITSARGGEGWPRWPSRLLLVVTCLAIAPCLQETWGSWRPQWAPPPLWLAGCLSLAGAAAFCVPLLYVRRTRRQGVTSMMARR